MTEFGEQFAEIMRRLDAVEKAYSQLAQSVRGDSVSADPLSNVEDRLASLERMAVQGLVMQGEPAVVQDGQGSDANDVSPIDIEWGVPKADPTDVATATITLRPCDKDGVEYAGAADVVAHIRGDRAAVQLGPRGWKASAGTPWTIGTILSFYRYPRGDIGSYEPYVVGVLVGEGEPDKVRVSVDDTKPGFLRVTGADQQTFHKIIGDSELDAVSPSNPTGSWIQAVVINEGEEEQLKIEHVGPGNDDENYTWEVVIGATHLVIRGDSRGHLVGVSVH